MHLQTLTNVCQLGLGSGHIIYGVLREVVCGGWVGGCVWGVCWGVGIRGLLKMHTQASRGNDFSTLLFATTLGNDASMLIFSRYPSMLYFFITGDAGFLFE